MTTFDESDILVFSCLMHKRVVKFKHFQLF